MRRGNLFAILRRHHLLLLLSSHSLIGQVDWLVALIITNQLLLGLTQGALLILWIRCRFLIKLVTIFSALLSCPDSLCILLEQSEVLHLIFDDHNLTLCAEDGQKAMELIHRQFNHRMVLEEANIFHSPDKHEVVLGEFDILLEISTWLYSSGGLPILEAEDLYLLIWRRVRR